MLQREPALNDGLEVAPPEQVRELTHGHGADYVFDVVGGPESVAESYRMVGKGAMLVLVGYGPMSAELHACMAAIARPSKAAQ